MKKNGFMEMVYEDRKFVRKQQVRGGGAPSLKTRKRLNKIRREQERKARREKLHAEIERLGPNPMNHFPKKTSSGHFDLTDMLGLLFANGHSRLAKRVRKAAN